MKNHHFRALYYARVGVIEQQFIRDWFDNHRVTKYTGRRFTPDMVILDEELIYNLVRKMNKLQNQEARDKRIDNVIAKFAPSYCCNKIGTVV
jgi:hypothetical protein